ncbi:MAG TPA: hypothetical protein VKP03_02065 [Patescibacteria group bacterium]|nr:hypothetical protein [Patescibacteria group bacterium]
MVEIIGSKSEVYEAMVHYVCKSKMSNNSFRLGFFRDWPVLIETAKKYLQDYCQESKDFALTEVVPNSRIVACAKYMPGNWEEASISVEVVSHPLVCSVDEVFI